MLTVLAVIVTSANCQEDYRLVYDSTSGGMIVEVPASLSAITAFEVRSHSGVFTGTRPELLNGLFDVFKAEKLFWLNVDGFGTTDFGPVAAPGLELPFLASDLCVKGALEPSGPLPDMTIVDAASSNEHRIFGCSLIDNPHSVVLEYDSTTGQVFHDVLPRPRELVSLYLQSSGSPFVESHDPIGMYDAYTSSHLLKFNLNGFEDGSFGSVLPAGLTDIAASEFCVAGRFSDGQIKSALLNGNPIPQCHTFNLTIDDFKDLPDSSQPTTLSYFSDSGSLVVEPPEDRSILAFGITSESEMITSLPRQNLNQRVSPNEAFFLARELSGLQNTEVRLPIGLTREELLADLTIAGKYDNGLDIAEFNLDVITPPPPAKLIASVTRLGDGDVNVVLAREIGPTVPVSIEDETSQVDLLPELIGQDQVILSDSDIGTSTTYQLEIGRLGILYVAIDDRDLNQPFDWMTNTAFTGLPVQFFDTGVPLDIDTNEDGIADETLSLWATIAPAGSYTIGPNMGEHQMLIFGASTRLPEPTTEFSFLVGLACFALLGRRTQRIRNGSY